MAKRQRRLRLPGTIDQVRVACDFVVKVAKSAGFGDDGVFQSQLAVEEIFTNIVEHGYKHDAKGRGIELITEITDDALLISILDEAPPFNPLQLSDPDPSVPLWERKEGGWGVHFVRNYMDDVRYKLEKNKNRLILEKKLPSSS